MSSIILNVVLCASVVLIGIILTKRQKKYSKETGSYQLRAYIPTIWTSLGILGTFVSILYSLILFANDTNDTNNINSLIFNIAPAFSTSIIGIIGSIWTSLSNKRSLASVESEEDRKFKQLQEENNISRSDEAFSPEEILLNILKEIKDGRIESAEENGKLIKELGTLFGKTNSAIVALQNNLGEKQDNLASTIKQEYRNAREDLKKQKEDFDSVVNDVKTKFESTISEQNRILENKLNTLDQTLKDKIEHYNETCRNLITDLIKTIKERLTEESKQRNEELKGFINDTTLKITNLINEQVDQYKGINGKMDAVVFDIRKLFEEDVKQAIERFAEEQHQVSIETLSQWNSKLVADANESINRHSAKMRRNLSKLNKRANATYNSFDESINGLVQSIDATLQNLYQQQEKRMKEISEENGKHIETSLETNRKSIEAILNANKNAIESVSREMAADNKKIKEELKAAHTRWENDAKELERKHFDEVKKIYTDAEKDIQEIQTKITHYDSTIQQMLGNIKNELITSVGVFKEKIIEIEEFIINNNKGLQTDLRSQIHDAFQIKELEIACKKVKDGIDSTINSLNANTSEIMGNLYAINTSLDSSSKKYIDTVVKSNDLLTYINETLLVDKENITSVAVILGQMETLKKVATEIEENIRRIQSIQGVETEKPIRGKKQES